MNKYNNHFYKLLTIGLLTAILGVYTQCIPETKKISVKEAPIVKPKKMDAGDMLMALEVSSGVKSYEELFVTYEALTGVSTTTNNPVRSTFEEVKVSLPTDNNAKSFLSGHQVATVKLASSFCDEMVKDTTLRERIWTTENFSLRPDAQAFSEVRRDELLSKMTELFWGPSIRDEDKAAALDELDKLITDLLLGENATTANTTVAVVKSVCTAALSSMYVTMK